MSNNNQSVAVDNNQKEVENPVIQDNEAKDKNKTSKPKKERKERKKLDKEKVKGLKIIIMAVVGVILVLGSIYLLMKLPSRADEIKVIRTQSLAYRISGQDEVLLVKTLKENEELMNKLMEAFPNETSLLKFIRLMEGLRSEDLEILKSSLDSDVPTKIGKSSSFLPVTLMLQGDGEAVDKALNKIVDSIYFVKIVNFSKEYDLDSDQVIASVQFHLFVADEF